MKLTMIPKGFKLSRFSVEVNLIVVKAKGTWKAEKPRSKANKGKPQKKP